MNTEEALREREERYRMLVESIEQGFCVFEVLFDADGRASDYRWLEANPAFERHTGLINPVGKTARELVPELERHWLVIYGRVALTGAPRRFVEQSKALGRWFAVEAFRVGKPERRQVALLFSDITARKRAEHALRDSEARQRFLLELNDRLRPLSDPQAIMSAAAEALGRRLNLAVVGYADVGADGQTVVGGGEYSDGRMVAIRGPHRIFEYGDRFGPAMHAGRDVAYTDISTEARGTTDGSEEIQAMELRAAAAIPLIRDARLVAYLYAMDTEPRAWRDHELSLLRQVAERTWAAVKRANAEQALRQSEAKYRALFESMHEGLLLIEVIFVDGEPVDPRCLEANPAAIKMVGQDYTGHRLSDVWPQTDPTWSEMCDRVVRTGEGEHLERWARSLNTLFDVHVFKTGDAHSNRVAVLFHDITERERAREHIQFLAWYDPLTQLPNRRLLLDRLQHALSACSRNRHKGAVFFLDLDNFKTLNDTLGHDTGDLLLKQAASRLCTAMRESDTVGRLGGDEFVIIIEQLSDDAEAAAVQAKTVGEKILATLRKPYALAGREHHATTSVGLALFGDRDDTVDEVMKRADLAMYRAKAMGRNTLQLFDPAMQAAVNRRASLEVEIREGLERREFHAYYQPQVDASGRLSGLEALARWQHPRRGLIGPAEFIPMAEETGLIIPLGRVMLEAVCERLATWSKTPQTAHLTLALNVSATEFHHPDFAQRVLDVIRHTGANPQRLTLELTEAVLVKDVEDAVAKMSTLSAQGVRFSLDDFGTGYSSLYNLRRLPLSELKLDQRFVRDVLTDPSDAIIVRTMIVLADSLGLTTIAEGVETEAVRDYLHGNNCLAYQGYLFAPPLSAGKLDTFLRVA